MYDVAVLGYHAGRAQWPLARTYLPEVARSIAMASRLTAPYTEIANSSWNLQNSLSICKIRVRFDKLDGEIAKAGRDFANSPPILINSDLKLTKLKLILTTLIRILQNRA